MRLESRRDSRPQRVRAGLILIEVPAVGGVGCERGSAMKVGREALVINARITVRTTIRRAGVLFDFVSRFGKARGALKQLRAPASFHALIRVD